MTVLLERPCAILYTCIGSGAIAKTAVAVARGGETVPAPEVSTVESVAHSYALTSVVVGHAVSTPMIPTSSAIYSPTVSAAIGDIKVGAPEVEVVAMWVACVDTEAPIACIPIEGAVEVCSVDV